jgi:hypothetical protein
MTNYFAENKPSEDFARRSLHGGMVSIGARVILYKSDPWFSWRAFCRPKTMVWLAW